ncbi:restriction endonuclease subunit S [Salmonella enterica]|nr:restriction endonuclease subunit S [Salmonella enterica]
MPVVSSGGISSYHNEAKVSGPGVVLGRKGSLGTVFYIDGPYWPHDTTLWIKDFKNNNPAFVYYFFRNISQLLKDMDVGAANPALNRNHVHPLEVLWPNRKTQKGIADILVSLDAKINNNTKVNQILEEMAQALFKSWFIDFEPVKAKIAVLEAGGSQEEATLAAMTAISGKNADTLKVFERENPEQCAELKATAELFPSAMQESELGEIPAGWSIKPLDEIAVYQNGLALQKFRPEDENDFLPVVKIAQLKKGFADGEEKASPNIKPECIIDNGDVIFSWSGSLVVDIWCGGKAALNQHLFKVFSTSYPKWIYYKYTTHHLNEFQRIAEAKAVTMGHIKREHLSQAKCVIPPSGTINTFTPFFEPLLNRIISNRLECQQIDKIRNDFLPKLLSGEITLPEAEEIAKEADYV